MDSVIAIVTFAIPSEAKRAFNHLSYRKYQHTPLYLEYLPIDLWNDSTWMRYNHNYNYNLHSFIHVLGYASQTTLKENTTTSSSSIKREEATESTTSTESELTPVQHEVTIGEESDSTTLYIKNLSWTTTDESVRKFFGQVDGLKVVTLPKKKGPNGESLPMGFGFVVYETRQQALKALNRFNGKALDGHILQLKFSARKDVVTTKKRKVTTVEEEDAKGNARTKLMVRNIPFEATRTELRELFGSFGQLKSLRLPKKFDGTSRGFVFVEYLSSDDAKTAVKALGSTHLLGRKLVVEYAKEESPIASQGSHIKFADE